MRVTVSKSAILYNLIALKKYGLFHLALKSNAYGIGISNILPLIDCDTIFVRDYSEALKVRKLDSKTKIITLVGYEYIEYENNIMPAVINLNQYQEVKKNKIEYWIHFDIGMNRTGIKDQIYNDNDANGVLAHFSISNLLKIDYQKGIQVLTQEYLKIKDIFSNFNCIKSLAKTSVLKYLPEEYFKNNYYNRVGMGIYNFQVNAITITANIIDIKFVRQNDYISYDLSYIASKDMKIAIVNCGYAHGFNMNTVSINNHICNRVGIVCMEFSMFDITDIDAKIGDLIYIYDYQHIDLYNIATNNIIEMIN